jgi:hypothetical protein
LRKYSQLRDSLVITAWCLLRKLMEKRPLDKGDSYRYTEQVIADNRKVVVPHVGDLREINFSPSNGNTLGKVV